MRFYIDAVNRRLIAQIIDYVGIAFCFIAITPLYFFYFIGVLYVSKMFEATGEIMPGVVTQFFALGVFCLSIMLLFLFLSIMTQLIDAGKKFIVRYVLQEEE